MFSRLCRASTFKKLSIVFDARCPNALSSNARFSSG
jgi:hypothetical protein